jgi:flagellar hook-associated protein 1 FlgK
MASEFMGLEIGKRGLLGNQTALNTVSHNLSNSSNKDYSRQEVNFQTVSPLYAPQLNRAYGRGQLGQGMEIASVMRVRDQFIDSRIMTQKSSKEFDETKSKYLTQMEHIFSEPGETSLKERFDEFVKNWNDVALNSDDPAARASLVTAAQTMIGSIRDHYGNLQDMRNHVNSLIESKVGEINDLATQIKDLNVEILKVKALKDEPNDLMDKRDALIEKLSKITNIKVNHKDPDEVFVYIGSQALVQGVKTIPLKAVGNGEKDGMFDVQFEDGKTPLINDGELAALVQVRDENIPEAMQKINNFVINMAETINSVHEKGFGLNTNTGISFFNLASMTDDSRGNYDTNADGQIDSTRLYSIRGNQKVDLNSSVNEPGVLNLGPDDQGKDVLIDYKATDTVRDIMDKVNNSSAKVSMALNNKGFLTIKALYTNNMKESFSIRHLEDSGNFLTSLTGILNQSGGAGAFDSNAIDQANRLATNDIRVSYQQNIANHINVSEAILRDPNNIAARGGKDTDGDGMIDMPNGAGDGSNAFQIISKLTSTLERNPQDPNVGLDNHPIMIDKGISSFRPYLDTMIAKIGEDARSSKTSLDKNNTILSGLENMRQSISGVNIDEEMVQLIKYQHGYQGSAKIISVMDEMLDTIIHLGR